MYQSYLQNVLAKPFAWSEQFPKEGDYLETHDNMCLKISSRRMIMENYWACKTCRGTYFVDCTETIGHESAPRKNTYIGVIRVTPEQGGSGAPLEFIDHERNNEFTLLYDAPGMPTMNKIEDVFEIWNNFYSIKIDGVKFYVIRVE